MGLFKDIEKSFKRLTEGVDDVSDKEAKSKFKDLEDKDLDNDGDADSSDKYLHKRLGKVAKMDEEEEIDEMSSTGGVAGYMTPKAFGKADDDTVEAMGMKRVKKTNKVFRPMENKSSYKKMMSEMYGVVDELHLLEAVNPELDRAVKRFIDALAKKYGYKSSDAVMAVFQALTRLNLIHNSVKYKAPAGFEIEEAVSYRQYKKDESASPSQKVNKSIMEVNKMLAEIEKIVHNNIRLKTETGVDSSQFWKQTGNRINKINERIVRISNRLKELSN